MRSVVGNDSAAISGQIEAEMTHLLIAVKTLAERLDECEREMDADDEFGRRVAEALKRGQRHVADYYASRRRQRDLIYRDDQLVLR